MTLPQIAALSVLLVTVAVVYGRPLLDMIPALPSRKPSQTLLDHISDVIAIREAHPTPEIVKASNALQEALLKVSP